MDDSYDESWTVGIMYMTMRVILPLVVAYRESSSSRRRRHEIGIQYNHSRIRTTNSIIIIGSLCLSKQTLEVATVQIQQDGCGWPSKYIATFVLYFMYD